MHWIDTGPLVVDSPLRGCSRTVNALSLSFLTQVPEREE